MEGFNNAALDELLNLKKKVFEALHCFRLAIEKKKKTGW
jgi:hypothetical protein